MTFADLPIPGVGETVEIVRTVPYTDPWGNTTPGDWSTATRTPSDGWIIAPRLADEGEGARSTATIVGLWAYGPAGTDLLPTDRIGVRGRDYEIDGVPEEWRDPWTDRRPGIQVALTRIEG